MFLPPIGKIVVLPERVRKDHHHAEKHRCYQPGCYPQWQLVLRQPCDGHVLRKIISCGAYRRV